MVRCCVIVAMGLMATTLQGETPAAKAPAATVQTVAALRERLEAHIQQARFAQARWGVKVVSLDSGKTLFERDADKLMVLASNTKLFTGGLALNRLGPEFRIQTRVFANAKPSSSGVVAGDLIIRGAGDPSFSERWRGGAVSSALQPLVDAMIAAGVRRVDGGLIGDNSCFRSMPWGAGWEWDDLEWAYAPSVSALCLNDNAVGVTVKPAAQAGAPCEVLSRASGMQFVNLTRTLAAGAPQTVDFQRAPGQPVVIVSGGVPVGGQSHIESVSVAAPAQWFVKELGDALSRRGVIISGPKRAVEWWEPRPVASGAVEIARVSSPPARDLVKDMMKHSQNLGAQLLLLQTGLAAGGSAVNSPERAGLAALRQFLSEAGVKPGAVSLKEGSGLSSNSQATPSALTTFLVWMAGRPQGAAFVDCLPVAGVDGTLSDRLKGAPTEGRVWAKTGTKDGVSALSGYLVAQGNERMAFSILLNNYKDPNRTPRDETDALVRILAGFSGRSETTVAR
jgi:D-alanyl-D-alanine carboxypeptidase/D-alanyl-D-alanine-endopeptidase (penicillin-binding protein 4)